MNRHVGLGLGLIALGLALLAFVGCATCPECDRALDRAAAMGLAREGIERPYARINDGAPWTKLRRVETLR